MIFIEIIESTRIAFEQIFASKFRSFLSTLGVVIGISVVIIMGWLIMALNDVVESTFQMMGSDMLWVSRFDWAGRKTWEEMRNRKRISLEQCEQFKAKMQGAELVVIQGSRWGESVKYKNDTYTGITIEGDDYNFQWTNNGEIIYGRYFSITELNYGTQSAILGFKTNETLFPNGNSIGKRITVAGRHFIVIGVLKKKGTAMADFVDNKIVIPLSTFTKIYGKNQDFQVGVKANEVSRLDAVRIETQGVMRTIRNIAPKMEDDFSINESKAFEEQTIVIRASIYGVGIGMTMLSFIVGIIGVMNIMLVSVTERIKEIGIRKAVGAKNRSILVQFIVEAAALCFIGALISFILCSVLIYVLATVAPNISPSLTFFTPYLPLNLLGIASLVSIFVGVLAGIIPAMRAANLPPIEALQSE